MFSKIEIIHMTISVLTISLAFSLPFFLSFPMVLLTVGLGFILHEIAHKVVAVHFGCVAVYRAWLEGLIIAVAMAIATGGRFVFAAPGAVYIYKDRLTRRENGLISLAGPLTNVLLGIGFLFVSLAPSLETLGIWGFRVNLFLGMFNLIPIPPLDGSKVLGWNVTAWGALFFVALAVFFFPSLFLSVFYLF